MLPLSFVGLGIVAAGVGQPCEPHWSDQFHGTRLDSMVRAMTIVDDGSGEGHALYVGGGFTMAGDVAVNHIAKREGQGWSPLGSGTDGTVLALTDFDDGSGGGSALFAGGTFTTAGGVQAHNIAKWNGDIWLPVLSVPQSASFDLSLRRLED